MWDSVTSERRRRFLVGLIFAQLLAILVLASDAELQQPLQHQHYKNGMKFPYDVGSSNQVMGMSQARFRQRSTDQNNSTINDTTLLLGTAYDGTEINQPTCSLPYLLAASAQIVHGNLGVISGLTSSKGDPKELLLMLARHAVSKLENDVDENFAARTKQSDDRRRLADEEEEEGTTAMPEEQLCVESIEKLVNFAKDEMVRVATTRKLKTAVTTLMAIVNRMNESRVIDDEEVERLNVYDREDGEELLNWERFLNGVSRHELYSDKDGVVDELVKEMRTLPVVAVETQIAERGTQMHLGLILRNGGMVFFKPKRLERDYELSPDVDIYYDIERHSAEIAAYHLDRLLGRRRVPPTVGRKLHIIHDIQDYEPFDATGLFRLSETGHVCFLGVCEATCNSELNPICADDHKMLEGSMSAWFPSRWADNMENPFTARCKNCYTVRDRKAFARKLSRDSNYCSAEVRARSPFNNDRVFLNLVDAQIFDFLTGNLDRHHFDHYMNHWDESFFVLYDNGKGFGTAKRDQRLLLAPLYQCCMVRLSTVERLLGFHNGPDHLSDRMRRSLATDDLDEILTEAHLAALDRRVAIILEEIYKCTQKVSDRPVIVDDGL